MKKIILLIALVYISVSKAFAGVSVISGMEDTLKRTRGENFRGFYNSVFSHKIFSGMDKLAKDVKGDLYFVSDKYNFLNFNSEDLVEDFNIKPKEIVAREPFAYDSEFSYKYAAFKRIIQSSEDQFILVGNDTGSDQEVFAQIKKEFPNKILEAYIHVVENDGKLESGMVPYHTAFDIALNEYSKGRLSKSQVANVGSAILDEEKFHKVFPQNSHCPKDAEEITAKNIKTFEKLISGINQKTLEYCNG